MDIVVVFGSILLILIFFKFLSGAFSMNKDDLNGFFAVLAVLSVGFLGVGFLMWVYSQTVGLLP